MGLAAVFLTILLSTPAVFGAQFIVDWTIGTSYSSWATKPLNEGDTLVFNYDGTHSVDVVSQSDFLQCDSSNALQSNNRSPTTITLKAGTTHIICGTPGHCSGGMKLQVTAQPASGFGGSTSTAPTPAPASGSPSSPAVSGSSPIAPSPFSSPSTPADSGSSPIAPPSRNGAAGSLLSSGGLGFGLGFGALVAFFG